MRIVWFVHAIASCWNNGNAHFLRGVGTELQRYGHDVVFCEPANGWSEANRLRDEGARALDGFAAAFPDLVRVKYDAAHPDLPALTHDADLVIAHEWNEIAVVNALGQLRKHGAKFVLLFHDTHHRALTRPDEMRRYNLDGYDGVLAFGAILAQLYEKAGWSRRAWAWHEAAGTSRFFPRPSATRPDDLVWVGKWGDEERTTELHEYLLDPASSLGLRVNIYGVRYPDFARNAL